MKTVLVKAILAGMLVLTGSLLVAPPSAGAWVGNAHYCQCVEYILNRFYNGAPLAGNWPTAASMATTAYWNVRAEDSPRRSAQAVPIPGAIAIFQPGVLGFDGTSGHIGVVEQAWREGSGWHLELRSSNWGAGTTDASCNNVSTRPVVVPNGLIGTGNFSAVTFWQKTGGAATPGNLQVSSGLYLSSTNPKLGEVVRAEFWVRNTGGQRLTLEQLSAGARRGGDWNGENVDFPSVFNIVLDPGQSYFYQQVRSFPNTGSHFAEPVVKISGQWGGIQGANRIWFTVQDAGFLVVSSWLYLSNTTPQRGQGVRAEFWVRNVGTRPITLEQLSAGARRGGDWNGENVDFPSVYWIVLQPGQSYFYQQVRSFPNTGSHFAEPVVKISGQWGGIQGANRIWFTVK